MAGTTCSTAADYFKVYTDAISTIDTGPIDAFCDLIFDAWENDRNVFVFGNGGSTATASHYVADLVKTAMVEGQKRLRTYCLVDNFAMTMALGNDVSFEDTFVFPLESYARPGDIAVAISCSGNSPNIVKAVDWAKRNGVTVVAISGFKGGKMAEFADIHINVPHDNYGVIEDIHMSIGHIATQALFNRVTEQAGAQAKANA